MPVDAIRYLRMCVLACLVALTATQCTGRGEVQVRQSPTPSPAETAPLESPPASPAAASTCEPGGATTPSTTEGPYFKEGTPERTSFLEPGIEGTKLILTGSVLDTNCKPISGARLEFWHAGSDGEYDNEGYRLRGHQFTDEEGQYRLETIATGEYSGRTRHIHVKVQPANGRELTTQLFFPGDPGNERDRIFDEALVMKVQNTADGQTAQFDFVVAT